MDKKVPHPNGPTASVIDLFCGVGGLSHGFSLEGFHIAAGYDLEEACRYPFEHNNSAPFVRADVAKLKADTVAKNFSQSMPKVLIGCAPCQPFSKYSQGREDPKWNLLKDFARLAVEVEPDILSMENVPQLSRFHGGVVFDEFVETLQRAGYEVVHGVHDCTRFGVPQTRSRLVLIASKLGTPKLPEPDHEAECITVKEAIGSMRPLNAGEIDPDDPLHRTAKLSEINLNRIRSSVPGGTWRDWDDDLVAPCHRRSTGRGYSSVYGRMEWEAPSPTITTQFYGFGNGRYGHPEQDRAISLREGAILQSFPADYAFIPPSERIQFTTIGRMIGNAVPVALARAVARAIKLHIQETDL